MLWLWEDWTLGPRLQEPKRESCGNPKGSAGSPPKAKLVVSNLQRTQWTTSLSSDSGDGDVCVVRVRNKGSRQCCASVEVQGVGALGVVDTGADITTWRTLQEGCSSSTTDFKPVDKKPYLLT